MSYPTVQPKRVRMIRLQVNMPDGGAVGGDPAVAIEDVLKLEAALDAAYELSRVAWCSECKSFPSRRHICGGVVCQRHRDFIEALRPVRRDDDEIERD